MRKILGAIAFVALCISSMHADQVVLSNGDRLTGAIVKSDAKNLVLKTEFAGEVTIQWDAVRDVEAALEETFEEQIVFRAPCHGSERTAASATRRGAGVGWSSTWAARASTTASHSLRSCSCC